MSIQFAEYPKSWPAPMAHSYRLGLVTWRYKVRIPIGTDICHRGCAYRCSKLFKGMECTVLSMVLCTLKNPVLSRYCPNVQKAT